MMDWIREANVGLHKLIGKNCATLAHVYRMDKVRDIALVQADMMRLNAEYGAKDAVLSLFIDAASDDEFESLLEKTLMLEQQRTAAMQKLMDELQLIKDDADEKNAILSIAMEAESRLNGPFPLSLSGELQKQQLCDIMRIAGNHLARSARL